MLFLKGPTNYTHSVSANATSHHLLGTYTKQPSVNSVSTIIN